MNSTQPRESEISILTRVFSDHSGQWLPELARYILELDFSDTDRARMHELIVRNQDDSITPSEKDELVAFTNAGSMLAILQSRARGSLGIKPEKRAVS